MQTLNGNLSSTQLPLGIAASTASKDPPASDAPNSVDNVPLLTDECYVRAFNDNRYVQWPMPVSNRNSKPLTVQDVAQLQICTRYSSDIYGVVLKRSQCRYLLLPSVSIHVRSHMGSCQPSATSPLFWDNLHFGQIAKSVNLDWWLTLLAICPKSFWVIMHPYANPDEDILSFSVRKFPPVASSRRQLAPVFDKPAFSRFSQNEPLIVVEIFGKIVKRPVCQKRG